MSISLTTVLTLFAGFVVVLAAIALLVFFFIHFAKKAGDKRAEQEQAHKASESKPR